MIFIGAYAQFDHELPIVPAEIDPTEELSMRWPVAGLRVPKVPAEVLQCAGVYLIVLAAIPVQKDIELWETGGIATYFRINPCALAKRLRERIKVDTMASIACAESVLVIPG